MGGLDPGMVTPVKLFPFLSRIFKATLAVVELPLKIYTLACGLPAALGKFAGVQTQTKGGPEEPAGPGGPWGPCGPCGPVTFHSTRVSLAWQGVLESTRRIIPLPGLMQASSMAEGLAETRLASTRQRTTATTPRPTIPARRTKVSFIQFPFSAEALYIANSARQCRYSRPTCQGACAYVWVVKFAPDEDE